MTDQRGTDRCLAVATVIGSTVLAVAGALVDGAIAFVLLAAGTLPMVGWALLVDSKPGAIARRREPVREQHGATRPLVATSFVVKPARQIVHVDAPPPPHLLRPQPRSAVSQIADGA
jgi:hypothetical protein